MNRSELRRKVSAKIKAPIYNDMEKYFLQHSPSLWGIEKPGKFFKDALLLTLYKDLYHKGFNTLASEINLGYKISSHSLKTNIPRVRNSLRTWANDKLRPGNSQEWKQAAHNCSLPETISDATLWLDSSDFRLKGRSNHRTSDSNWSYKLNGPGQRFLFVMDARGKILKIYGGYSPNIYDSDAFCLAATDFNTTFSGGVALADSHFRTAKAHAPNVKFYVNFPERKDSKKRKRGSESSESKPIKLTKAQETFNLQHRRGRARVERPFGYFKSKFQSLREAWFEDEEQQDNLVYIAAAIHNMTLY